jgi:hypothetical protein
MIGKLHYLEKTTRSDISYIMHQCARFTLDPKKEHGQAVWWLGRYQKVTKDKGTILRPQKGWGLELYVDTDFSGSWDPKESWDWDTARSRRGYIVKYEGCPLLCKSQMQTEIALSSTESEYTGMSYGFREVIPIIEILKEIKWMLFPVQMMTPGVHCRVFEDNSGALEMATTHKKYRPRTKHFQMWNCIISEIMSQEEKFPFIRSIPPCKKQTSSWQNQSTRLWHIEPPKAITYGVVV